MQTHDQRIRRATRNQVARTSRRQGLERCRPQKRPNVCWMDQLSKKIPKETLFFQRNLKAVATALELTFQIVLVRLRPQRTSITIHRTLLLVRQRTMTGDLVHANHRIVSESYTRHKMTAGTGRTGNSRSNREGKRSLNRAFIRHSSNNKSPRDSVSDRRKYTAKPPHHHRVYNQERLATSASQSGRKKPSPSSLESPTGD